MHIDELYNDHLSRDPRSYIADDMFVTNRLVGVEVEVEGAENLQATALWNVINDPSLRNGGRELVCRVPLAGYDLRVAMEELQGLLINDPEVHVTERTSVHVHVDVRDLTTKQLSMLILLYVAFEAALYNYGGKNRYDNIYCPGISAAAGQLKSMSNLVSAVKRSSTGSINNSIRTWCKYTGINLQSVHRRGSVEFRAHEGTLDVSRITEWINVLLKLVDYATHLKGGATLFNQMNKGPEYFTHKVFGDMAPKLLQDGVYERFFKNNKLNLMYLLLGDEEYSPATKEPEANGDTEQVIATIRRILAEEDI